MNNSPLITYTKISPNRTSPRNHTVDRITIHCYVGQVTAERGCNSQRFVTADAKKGASCNYVVGYDGSIGLCVPESDRSWCSSNRANDHRAITIEVASDNFYPYAVTSEAYNALLDLCTDICKRHNKRKLLWLETAEKSLYYVPASDEMILTVHRWFANKACPGQHLLDLHGEIASEVTKRLEEDIVTQEQFNSMMDNYLQELASKGPNSWSKEARDWAEQHGIIAGDGSGNYQYQKFCSREELVQILYRISHM